MLDPIPPLILVRFISLFVFVDCIMLAFLWIRYHPSEWLYMTPPILIFTHAVIFYSFYLWDYFNPPHPFPLQFYADWGAFLILHIGFTSFFILIDLITNVFSDFIGRHFPNLVKQHGRSS